MKKICAVILAFALLLAFVSCGEPGEVDVNAAAEKINKSVKFSDELSLIDIETAKSVLLFEDDYDAEIAMYIGSGSSADQIIVAKSADADGLEAMLKAYVETQRTMYSWYMPDEAAKLENAVIQTDGETVIVCVTNDVSGAQKVIKKILK